MLAKFRRENVFVGDFETINDLEAIKERRTAVYAWAVCNINDIENVTTGWDISSFISWCMLRKKNTVVYFHNLKHDGRFIEHYLTVVEGLTFTRGEANEEHFTSCISLQGRYYYIRIKSVNGATIEFRDSTNKIPGTVKKIGADFKTKYRKLDDYDYSEKKRTPGTPLTGRELEYLKNDVRVIAEVIAFLYDEGMTALTIGADCMKYFKKRMNDKIKNKFRMLWPDLHGSMETLNGERHYIRGEAVPAVLWRDSRVPETEHEFTRRAYRGGFCYANPTRAGKWIKQKAKKYDVCSLYPSMMYSGIYTLSDGKEYRNLYPCGRGVYFEGAYEYDNLYPHYIICFDASFKVKDGFVPTVQLKNTPGYKANEYVTDSRHTSRGTTDGIVRLVMTSVDFEMFMEHYDVDYLHPIGGYKYEGGYGFFDEYITHFFEQKCNNKGAKKQLYKLFLNNLYGKLAQSVDDKNKYCFLGEDGRNHYAAYQGEEDREPAYMPAGAFITAYARRFTIDAIQANYGRFVYGDTDSMILLLNDDEHPNGIQIGSSKLQTWELESVMDEVKVIRQKTYMEHDIGDDKGLFGPDHPKQNESSYTIKCAGLPDEGKQYILNLIEKGFYTADDFNKGLRLPRGTSPKGGPFSWDDYGIGLQLPKGVKLRPMLCYGGQLLVPCDFKIRNDTPTDDLTDDTIDVTISNE